MIAWTRKNAWFGAGVSIAICSVTVMAQERNGQPDMGSLAALTAEVRQLRLAVEESTRSQAQTQALSLQEQQVRSREAELYQLMQTENTRWSDLISTLEQLIKK